jgi:hypothetical protein
VRLRAVPIRTGCSVRIIRFGLLGGRSSAANDVACSGGMSAWVSGGVLPGRVLRGFVVCADQLDADLVGLGVPQVFEYGQRLLPGLPGLGQFADGGFGEVA